MNTFGIFNRPGVLLFIAIFVGFMLRVLLLDFIPPGFNWDEASVAYNAFTLAQTGRDEFGRSWPLIIESFGDYKTGLYSILLVPFIKTFGLSVFVARFPNVLVGVLTIIASYYFARQYFTRQLPAALVALLIAISPWAIHVSRFVLEWHLGIPLTIFAGAFLLQAKEHPKRLLISAVFFASALYFYHSLRLFIPLLLLTHLVLNKHWFLEHKKEVVLSAVLGFFVALPFLFSAFSNNIFARPAAVSIFNVGNAGLAREGQYRQTVSHLPIFALINNTPTVYAQEFIARYLAHYSPQFLFTGQLQASPRTAIERVGLLYLVSLPFLIIGLYASAQKSTERTRLAFTWLLLAPVASSLSQDSPHELRSLLFLPIFQIFTVSGMLFVWKKVRTQNKLLQRGFVVGIFLMYLLQLLFFLNRYYLFYPEETALNWQAGYAELVQQIQDYEPFFDTIIITTGYGQPHIFFAFFGTIDPTIYQQAIQDQNAQFNGRIESLGKLHFAEGSPSDLCQPNTLVVTTHRGLDQEFKPFDTITTLNRFHEPEPLFKFYASSDPQIIATCTQNSTL